MPQHNLNEHLQWLLSVKPYIPPAASLVPYDPNASISSTALSQEFPIPSQPPPNHAPNAPSASESRGILPSVRPEPEPTLPKSVSTVNSSRDMARLRPTPGPIGKPRLLVAGQPPLSTPSRSTVAPGHRRRNNETDSPLPVGGGFTGTGRSIRRHDHRDNEPNRSSVRQSEAFYTPHSRPGTAEGLPFDIENIESIDLTSEMDSPVSFHQPHGKKRKSAEFEADLDARRQPPRERSSSEFERGIIDINDVVPNPTCAPPSDPPPPYSTIAPERLRVSEDFGDFSDDDSQVQIIYDHYDEPPIVEESPRNEPRKRKPLSREASVVSPPRKVGRADPWRSPIQLSSFVNNARRDSPSHRNRRNKAVKREVVDSEDDESEELETQQDPSLPVYDTLQQPRSTSPARIISQKPMGGFELRNSSQRSPPKTQDVSHAHTPKIELISSPAKTKAAIVKACPPENVVSPATAEKPITLSTPRAGLKDPPERFLPDIKSVQQFIASEGPRLEEYLCSMSSKFEKAKQELMTEIRSRGKAAKELSLAKRVNELRLRKQATGQLKDKIKEFDVLRANELEISRKIEVDIDDGNPNPADMEKWKEMTDALKNDENQILSLLNQAGFATSIPTTTKQEEQTGSAEVFVPSTQVTPTVEHAPGPEFADPGHVPQTQYVRQTQICVRESWSPSMGIRFGQPSVSTDRQISSLAIQSGNDSVSRRQTATAPIPDPRYESRATHLSNPSRLSELRVSNAVDRGVRTCSPALATVPKPLHESSDNDSFHTTPESMNEFDDDENLFSHNMGSPTARVFDDDEFDDDDLEKEMEEMDEMGFRAAGHSQLPEPRPAMKEIPENRVELRQIRHSPKKTVPESMNHPWSRDVKEALKSKFRLKGFRPGQLDAINTTLSGKHCFVLMPTGGGKSLCYQLPAVIRSGKTCGVTIVVSPLLSLMEDQVNACKARKIQADLINGECDWDYRKLILQTLEEPDPQKFIQLLYVTPEMLTKSHAVANAIQKLNERKRLARIVIDEAHCVSQWGHDFRPDYKAVGEVIKKLTGVPIIALTATATELVQQDVQANLGIENCRKFSQSFNRPNLSYYVLKKEKGVVASIADLILTKYNDKCGIVYCLARKTCEEVSKKLEDLNVKAHHYHAGMTSQERSHVQKQWQAGTFKVIVATIAFGMGIDKPDVRFVFHHSLPKSLEGYYQETGRAGRDGKPSDCYLYYGYNDAAILRKMIKNGEGDDRQKKKCYEMLRDVVQYCENKSDCRRMQVLRYFSEAFDPRNCKNTCDNCRSDDKFEERDFTQYASDAVRMVSQLDKDIRVTLLMCVDAFRGAAHSKREKDRLFAFHGLKEMGKGAELERDDVERMFRTLLEKGAFKEKLVTNRANFTSKYLALGPNSRDYLSKRQKLLMPCRVTPSVPTLRGHLPPSTNISSPVRAPSKRLQKFRHVEQGDDDDDFEPIREGPPRSKTKQAKPGTSRIETDAQLAHLDETQKDMLENFVTEAKKVCKRIQLEKSLREQPFSDTILRRIALRMPESADELSQIPEIRPEMVKLHGNKLLPLVEWLIDASGGSFTTPLTSASRRRVVLEADDENTVSTSRPADPNHRIETIILSDDSEDEAPADDSDFGSEVDFDNEEHVESHFFSAATDPRVEEYNRQASRLNQINSAPRNELARAERSKSKGFRSGGGGKKYSKRGASRKSPSGVSKKGSTKRYRKNSGNLGGQGKSSGSGNRRGGGGGGPTGSGPPRSGIFAMPT